MATLNGRKFDHAEAGTRLVSRRLHCTVRMRTEYEEKSKISSSSHVSLSRPSLISFVLAPSKCKKLWSLPWLLSFLKEQIQGADLRHADYEEVLGLELHFQGFI